MHALKLTKVKNKKRERWKEKTKERLRDALFSLKDKDVKQNGGHLDRATCPTENDQFVKEIGGH